MGKNQPMQLETWGETMLLGTVYLLIGSALTFITYKILAFLALAGLALANYNKPRWAQIIAAVYLLAAFISAIKSSADYWTDYRFNTTDPKDRISNVSLPSAGGRLWNMNPLGPQSSASFIKAIAAPLLFGPHFIAEGLKHFMRLVK